MKKIPIEFEEKLTTLYGNDNKVLIKQFIRYNEIIKKHSQKFSTTNIYLFSTSGRIEISGNHTDHNNGKVVAASIDLDTIATVSKNNRNEVKIYSDSFDKPFVVNLKKLSVVKREKGTTNSLIRGVAKGFVDSGFKISGFDAQITSNVLIGSGLSSSASIEVLIGTIFNYLYNDGKIKPGTLAEIGQYAENVYFGKPCGLMDQMACAVGGIIEIDFKNTNNPKVKKVNFDFNSTGYDIVIVNTGGNHSDLTNEYTSIPLEMKCIAKALNKKVCREITYNSLIKNIIELRKKCNDRAVLRAIHFLEENERVVKISDSLHKNDFNKFLSLINQSGNSSYKFLQNIFSTSNFKEQSISLALAITEKFITEIGEGACRVHGGGFAGTILVFIPKEKFKRYSKIMKTIFGNDSVSKLNIRNQETAFLGKL
jgi:galactokinase